MFAGRKFYSVRLVSIGAAILTALAMTAPAGAAAGATITVTHTADTVESTDGVCTLREAIIAANTNTASGPEQGECAAGTSKLDTIVFGPAFHNNNILLNFTIALPEITGPVVINALQPGDTLPHVQLNGVNTVPRGLVFAPGSSGSKLVGFAVIGFTEAGVVLNGGKTSLHMNWLGTLDGHNGASTKTGVLISSSGNRVGLPDKSRTWSNIITSNWAGVLVQSGAGNIIQGNFIGMGLDGTTALPNTYGVRVFAPSAKTQIGGATAGTGNLIAGNSMGIAIEAGASGTKITRNKIGTDWRGITAVRNDFGILERGGTGTVIGGAMPVASNLISGNTYGVAYQDNSALKTTIAGNLFGVRNDGYPLPNTSSISANNASQIVIKGNLIANSGTGIELIDGSATVLKGSASNCFRDNTFAIDNGSAAPAAGFGKNWWGHASGPYYAATNPGGQGDDVKGIGAVEFSPWLTKAPAACQGWAATATAPKDGSYAPVVTTFKLKAVKTAEGYNYRIADNPGLNSPRIDGNFGPSTQVEALPFGKWYWQTTTYTTPAEQVQWKSDVYSFWVTIMKTPAPGAEVKAGLVKFGWNAFDPTTSGYKWEAFSDAACTIADVGVTPNVNTAVTGTSLTATANPGVHYWRVTVNGGPIMPCWEFTAK